ncbi:pirin-like C-terminal cupin domain-containing protein [Cytophagaceae bacterium DM2B3-1]|uniref:Pirin-like C-terminal cupin domain-containing protein n=1 Tax=Xanthocytophaga flava TaxID=3048013 RepID=A0ABT7CRH0_9BACT|nr:pirin-like C-terminal cupin domain-containing protein [Xanthocytophaga flavus]MDJ1496351.1 pirin-like C-terminal cupin domain-containing protein [Xanthocytophaga flavus]
MTTSRKLVTIQTPAPHQGFLGKGHTARAVIDGNFIQSDPFVILMDDMLDKKDGEPAGGPHPHAGFETVSLLLEGEIGDTAHKMKGGDFQMMTAGSGVIHTETIDTETQLRLLQLWLILPKKDRWTTPRVQDLPAAHVPVAIEEGVLLKVYSGTLAGVTSPVKNYVPLVVGDIHMQPNARTVQHIPAAYNAFIYVLEGSVKVGADGKTLHKNQVGWFDREDTDSDSELIFEATEQGARFVLYAGMPQGDPIVSHGPFIGDTQDDIRRLYNEYWRGKMEHISEVEESQRMMW